MTDAATLIARLRGDEPMTIEELARLRREAADALEAAERERDGARAVPKLNMSNCDFDQVVDVNNTMIQIWRVSSVLLLALCLLATPALAADWSPAGLVRVPDDPHAAMVVDIDLPRPGASGRGWQTWRQKQWHLIDVPGTIGACFRVRLSLSRGNDSAGGETIGVAFRRPGTWTEHEAGELNGLACKGHTEGGENGIRDDCYVCVASDGQAVEWRWIAEGFNPYRTRDATGSIVIWAGSLVE